MIQEENNKFTWGDSVIISKNAPSGFLPGQVGSICGFYQVISKETANEFLCDIGSWIYTIEFENGQDIQIAEPYLEKDLGIISGKEFSKYSKYFVNGFASIMKIKVDHIEIRFKSRFINERITDNILISKEGYFLGNLILLQIEEVNIQNNSSNIANPGRGTILAFEISGCLIKLLLRWESNKTTLFNIKSNEIWWEQRLT